MQPVSWCIVLGLTVSYILVIFIRNATVFDGFKFPKPRIYGGPPEKEANLFAIITNTEECLPANLLATEFFGNTTSCKCHVYVASYRKRCKEDTRFPHVHYYFKEGIRMTAGSNAGYFQAKRSSNSFLYYIFMDDDVRLSYTKYTREEDVAFKVPAFRIFTNFLEEYRPARCGPDYQGFNKAKDLLERWHLHCNRFKTQRVLSVSHLDACFHAVHRDASDFVLPFPEQYDKKSNWLSIIQLSLSFFIYFRGQTIYFPEIIAFNDKHRYSTIGHLNFLYDKTIIKEMVESIRRKTPPEYKKHPHFAEAMNYPIAAWTHLLCKDPPPARTPIAPFKNLSYRMVT